MGLWLKAPSYIKDAKNLGAKQRVFIAGGWRICSFRNQDHFKGHLLMWWEAVAKVKSPSVPTAHKHVSSSQERAYKMAVVAGAVGKRRHRK